MRRKSALELRRKKTTCCNFGGSNEKPETCPLEFHHRGAVSLCCALKSIALYAQSNPPSILTDSRQLIVLVTPTGMQSMGRCAAIRGRMPQMYGSPSAALFRW